MTFPSRRGLIATLLALSLSSSMAAQASAESGYLPGLGAGLIDGDGQPSLLMTLMPYEWTEAAGMSLRSRFALAVQRYSPAYDGGAPSSDAAISAASLRGYRLFSLAGSWYGALGAGFRHRTLVESWVSLDDDSITAQIDRGDIYGHGGISYAWQRESSLIWLDLVGVQLQLAELYRRDNLSDHNVLEFWKNQLRGSFHRDADRRLRLTLFAVTFIPSG